MKDLFSKTSTVVVLLILVGIAVVYYGKKANSTTSTTSTKSTKSTTASEEVK